MKKTELFIDLGCGDGRVLRRANRRFGVRAIGYELNMMAFLRAILQCLGYPKITIRQDNFFNADLSAADVVFCYLYPDVMDDLAEKLKSELKPGARIASSRFTLTSFSPIHVIHPEDGTGNDPIYIYRQDPP